MHEIFWGLKIQTNHLISARKPDQVIININKKEELLYSGLFCHRGPKKPKRDKSTKTLRENLESWGT